MRSKFLVWSGVAAAAVLAAGCGAGSTRSTAAYCNTFESEAVRIHDKFESRLGGLDAGIDPFGSLLIATGSLLEAQGDLVVMFDKMVDHAPDDIMSETEAVRDSFKAQADSNGKALTDPLGALGDGLVRGLTSMGSMNAVESYVQGHCDLSFMTSAQ